MSSIKSKSVTAPPAGVRFKKSMLAMCVMALSAPALAQDNTNENVEEIVVSGVRQNLQNAQDIKRNADTFVDSISSADIGSLPDRSVLEAMQRIPGVSIERFQAANDPDHFGVEGSGAVIRGMSATRSEFNGRDSFTANSGRGLSFQDVPPELMGGVDIYKNQSADMIEGGIGGTVSLRTRKPFDASGRVIAFNADYSYGDMAEEWTPTVSALFSDRWDTSAGEFGILFNVSSSSLKGVSHGLQADAYVEYRDDYTDFYRVLEGFDHAGPSDIAGAEAFAGGSIWMPNGSNATMKFDDRDRKGFATALQWENPDDTFLATVQFMRSDATLAWTENAIKYQSGYSRRQSIPLEGTAYEFDDRGLFQNGIITQDGRFSDGGWRSADPDSPDMLRLPHAADWANPSVPQFGQRFQLDSRYKNTQTVIDDFAANFKWTPNDQFELSLDLQHIKADTEDDDVTVMLATHAVQAFDVRGSTPSLTLSEPWLGLRDANPDIYGVAGGGQNAPGFDRFLPGFSNDPAGDSNWFQDPASYYWQSAMDHFERSKGESNAARLDGVYNFEDAGILTAVKVGARYANREQTVRSTEYNWGGLAPVWSQPADQIGWTDAPVVADLQGRWTSVDWSDFHGGGVINIPGNTILHPDSQVVMDVVRGLALPTSVTGDFEPAASRDGTVNGSYFLPSEIFVTEETNKAAYVRLDFGSDEFKYRFSGNIGLRYVDFERTATGSIRYPDILPDYLPPAGAPSVFDKPALEAWEAEQEAAYIDQNPGASEETIETYMDELMRFAGDAGNYFNATELGFGNDAATVEDATSKYDVVLPSFNLKVELTDELIGRFAVSKAIAMPDMDLVRNTTSLSPMEINRSVIVDTSVTPPTSTLISASVPGWTGSAGNPYLRPMESRQFDVSLEWYFDTVGSLTFSVFRKDLTNFFVTGAVQRSYTNPTSGVTQIATVDATRNEGEGRIQGFEIAYQQFYDMLPEPWDGLGLQANFSYIDSESIPNAGDLGEEPNAGDATDTGARVDLSGLPLQGQSKETYNLVAMYDKYDWSVRLAYNWRSKYLLTTRDVISRYPLWNDDAGFLDGSIFYNVNDNVTVGMQFTNLLNTQTKTIMILDGQGLEAGRSWFVNDRRVALLVKAQF